MYLPPHFQENCPHALEALIQAYPFASLLSSTADGFCVDHLPLLWHRNEDGTAVLRGHIAKANPLAQVQGNTLKALAIFHGPQAYVSPNWYPGKQEHGMVVPTWNYMVVHAHGRLRLVNDKAWLRELLKQLTDKHEQALEKPWQLDDAPADYLDKMLNAVLGIEIHIEQLQGKFKLSQNQPAANRQGVIAGLETLNRAAARDLAEAMREREL